MSYTQFDPNSKGLEDLNMTSDEVNRFSEAMKKKEFVDMLGEYMNEISDPANKVSHLIFRQNTMNILNN
jgi:hypothetical protein